MSEKKTELERRVQMLTTQRDQLTNALEEATDRVLLLERQAREHELQVINISLMQYVHNFMVLLLCFYNSIFVQLL